ncbi:hypothetical protein QQ020_06225 [Fulvivirgaceae bacterium BMA12]|uniref:Peptidase M10 metallopeptidase domain-containing protein n=1 Tax=Agaribacillus aureus TaxID=3051825 RepID=A0ABT8L1S6_9BACT|nr:hypothetical protein [Fulvivirgaceae bacterium BMA12]
MKTKTSKAMKNLRIIAWLISFIILVSLIVVGTGCGGHGSSGNDDQQDNPVLYNLQIDRHINADMNNNRSDAILSSMQSIITNDDGSGDIACDVNFSRNGDVGVFNTGTGIINSQADFLAVNGLPGEIKVVNQINWCGGIAPNIIGCAPVPGVSLVVVRFDESQEGILWLHEYGHNKGLSHRNVPDAVMNGVIGPTHKKINQNECNAYQNTVAPSVTSFQFPRFDALKDTMAIDDFVKRRFIRGVPYEEASKYGPKHVPGLLLMLSDSSNIAYWPNIVVTLGIIGDERAVTPIINLIKQDQTGTLSQELYNTKTSAIMALGYLVNKTGNQEALNFLKECLKPHAWDESQPNWNSPYQKAKSDRNMQLSSMAILGLTLSGHPEAIEALKSLKTPKDSEEEKVFQSQVSNMLDQAIGDCEEISEKGLLEYYRTSMKQ